jgi:hypothetical protein
MLYKSKAFCYIVIGASRSGDLGPLPSLCACTSLAGDDMKCGGYSTATTATDIAGIWNTALPPSDVPLNATG